jgi:hypothetical protein
MENILLVGHESNFCNSFQMFKEADTNANEKKGDIRPSGYQTEREIEVRLLVDGAENLNLGSSFHDLLHTWVFPELLKLHKQSNNLL